MWLFKTRPPFVKIEQNPDGIVDLDENAQVKIDVENKSCSIILKKGGSGAMAFKTVRRPYKGLETLFDFLANEIASTEAKKEEAKQRAVEQVEQEFAETSARLEKAYLEASEEVEVEVPDEEPETEAQEPEAIVEQ